MPYERSNWSKYVDFYDPIKVGSIDGTDIEPHDKALIRALNSKYTPNEKVKGDPKCTVFVARLNINTTEDTLISVFNKYGTIIRSRLVRDIVTGISKRYAFLEYKCMEEAGKAVSEMHGRTIEESEILVDYEMERTLKGWKPRRLGGGFGGRKESGQLRFGCRDRPFIRPIGYLSQPSHSKDIFRQQKRSKIKTEDETHTV